MEKYIKLTILLILLIIGQCSLFRPNEENSQDVLIAYDLYSTGYSERNIWLTNFDGTEDHLMLGETTDDFGPQFNLDGSGIFFISNRNGNRELFFADTAGQNLAQLTSATWVNSFDISPGGDRIVFVDDVVSGPFLYLVDTDGENLTLLSRGWDPVFVDDGEAVIFLNSAASRNIRKITIGATDTLEITTAAPASNIIAIAASRNKLLVESRANLQNYYSFYFMTPAGEFTSSLTFGSGINGWPTLSEDGQQIAYSAYSSVTNGWEIHAGNSALSTPRQLSKQGLLASNPLFFPGDEFVLYTQQVGGEFFLYQVDFRGKDETKITHTLLTRPISYDIFAY